MNNKISLRIPGPLPTGKFEIACVCENLIFERIEEGEKVKTITCTRCGATILAKDQESHYHIFITLSNVEEVNVSSDSPDKAAADMSNFSAHSFVIDGDTMASVEGFVQGIKFPEGDARREEAFAAVGKKAKMIGKEALEIGCGYVWWKERQIVYGSVKHHALIKRAIVAKFEQNPDALKSLLSTKKKTIKHDLGHPESENTSLPKDVFVRILTEIRDKY